METNVKIAGISFTNTNSFVITERNKDNSMFYIRAKTDFERELELIILMGDLSYDGK